MTITLTKAQAEQVLDAIRVLQCSDDLMAAYDKAKEAKSTLSAALSAPQQEPVAHVYPSTLEKFKTAETFGECFSIAVGCPEERSVPLYTHPAPPSKVVEAARKAVDFACHDINHGVALLPMALIDALRKALKESK